MVKLFKRDLLVFIILTNMRFIWIQQWTAVPVIMEDQESAGLSSGRRLPGIQRSGDPSTLQEISENDIHPASCKPYAKNITFYPYIIFQWSAHSAAANVLSGNSVFESNLQGTSQHHQGSGGRPFNIQSHYGGVNPSGNAPSGAFNMSEFGGALPESQSSRSRVSAHDPQLLLSGQPRFGSQENPQFAGQAMTANASYNLYPQQYSSLYQQTPPPGSQYPHPQTGSQAHSGGVSPGQATYVGQQYHPNQAQLYVYYPGQYGQTTGPHQGFQGPPGPYSPVYNRTAGVPYMTGYFPQQETDLNIMSGKAQTYNKPSAPTTNTRFNPPETYLRSGAGSGKYIYPLNRRCSADF